MYQNFTLGDCPVGNQLFTSILSHLLNHVIFHILQIQFKMLDQMEKESSEKKAVIEMIDNILTYPNMRRFMEEVES